MKKTLLISLLIGVTSVTMAQEARLLRFPTTNGTEVVFSYGGDLYKASINGGEAERLTSHIGYEMFARFAPDVAWETETWVADNPTHMVHLNGDKFLGPYK